MTAPEVSIFSSGVSKPYQLINEDDQSGLIAILGAFSLSVVLTSVPIRTYVRGKLGSLGVDDYAFYSATVFATVQAIVVFCVLREGLGKSSDLLDGTDARQRQMLVYTADILYIITLFLSKFSTGLFFLRLTPSRGHTAAIWSCIILSITWAISSMIFLGIRCHRGEPWIDMSSSQCSGLYTKWQVIKILDIMTEILLFSISVLLVWGIQMRISAKVTVVCAFAFRLPVIALTALHLHYLSRALVSLDLTLKISPAISTAQIQIGYSILASIVPCLKNFVVAFDKPDARDLDLQRYMQNDLGDSGIGGWAEQEGALRDGGLGSAGTFGMGRTRRLVDGLRPDLVRYDVDVHAEAMGVEAVSVTRLDGFIGKERLESDSSESRKMIIQKGVEWSVDYVGGSEASSPSSSKSHQGNWV